MKPWVYIVVGLSSLALVVFSGSGHLIENLYLGLVGVWIGWGLSRESKPKEESDPDLEERACWRCGTAVRTLDTTAICKKCEKSYEGFDGVGEP